MAREQVESNRPQTAGRRAHFSPDWLEKTDGTAFAGTHGMPTPLAVAVQSLRNDANTALPAATQPRLLQSCCKCSQVARVHTLPQKLSYLHTRHSFGPLSNMAPCADSKRKTYFSSPEQFHKNRQTQVTTRYDTRKTRTKQQTITKLMILQRHLQVLIFSASHQRTKYVTLRARLYVP